VGTGGARMSIPDRQKIAIGRALIKRPKVLILDQAAAVLDPSAQTRLVASVLAYRKGLGVYWVLNRVDLANRFGLVLVMDRGQLVERGSFNELMAKSGPLRNLLKPG
jgi:ABC-type multidrug transport system fused ATPase/permease subunit